MVSFFFLFFVCLVRGVTVFFASIAQCELRVGPFPGRLNARHWSVGVFRAASSYVTRDQRYSRQRKERQRATAIGVDGVAARIALCE